MEIQLRVRMDGGLRYRVQASEGRSRPAERDHVRGVESRAASIGRSCAARSTWSIGAAGLQAEAESGRGARARDSHHWSSWEVRANLVPVNVCAGDDVAQFRANRLSRSFKEKIARQLCRVRQRSKRGSVLRSDVTAERGSLLAVGTNRLEAPFWLKRSRFSFVDESDRKNQIMLIRVFQDLVANGRDFKANGPHAKPLDLAPGIVSLVRHLFQLRRRLSVPPNALPIFFGERCVVPRRQRRRSIPEEVQEPENKRCDIRTDSVKNCGSDRADRRARLQDARDATENDRERLEDRLCARHRECMASALGRRGQLESPCHAAKLECLSKPVDRACQAKNLVGEPVSQCRRSRLRSFCGEAGQGRVQCVAAFYVWKKKYAHLGVSELRRLRQREDENNRLKRLVADLTLDKHILTETIRKTR